MQETTDQLKHQEEIVVSEGKRGIVRKGREREREREGVGGGGEGGERVRERERGNERKAGGGRIQKLSEI